MTGNRGDQSAFSVRDLLQYPEFCRGWQDFAEGAGVPPDYDTWSRGPQSAYEEGRITAAEIRATGYPVSSRPGWKSFCLLAFGIAGAAERAAGFRYLQKYGRPT